MTESTLLSGRVLLRPTETGEFDELLVLDEAGKVIVHFEMMDDGCLWGCVNHPDPEKHDLHIRISSRGKLRITTEEC
jgi:hypothetical protein